MSKLSPAPWAVEPLQATHGADMAIVAADDYIVAIIQHEPSIQIEDDPDYDTVVWSDTDLANATALAVVPELLEALRKLADYVHWCEFGRHQVCTSDQTYLAAMTAIAKAEGQRIPE